MTSTDGDRAVPDIGPVALHTLVAVATILLVALDLLPVLFTGDVNRYHTIASGPTFWRDQPVEFPPLSAAMVWFVGRWDTASIKVLFVTNLVLDLATAAVVGRVWGRRAVNRYLVLVALILPLSLFRLDHLTVLVVVVGLGLARSGRGGPAGAVLGLGILGKLWPAALVAVRPRRDWRVALSAGVVVLASTLVWVLLFGVDAVRQVLSYRGATGWHIESVPGSLIRWFDHATPEMTGGAWRVGTSSPGISVALLVLGLAVLWRCWNLDDVHDRSLAVVVGVLVVSPLLSPQYLLWVCALAALVPRGARARHAAWLVAAATALTVVASTFYAEVLSGSAVGLAMVGARNLVLVVLLVVMLRHAPAGPPASRLTGVPARGTRVPSS